MKTLAACMGLIATVSSFVPSAHVGIASRTRLGSSTEDNTSEERKGAKRAPVFTKGYRPTPTGDRPGGRPDARGSRPDNGRPRGNRGGSHSAVLKLENPMALSRVQQPRGGQGGGYSRGPGTRPPPRGGGGGGGGGPALDVNQPRANPDGRKDFGRDKKKGAAYGAAGAKKSEDEVKRQRFAERRNKNALRNSFGQEAMGGRSSLRRGGGRGRKSKEQQAREKEANKEYLAKKVDLSDEPIQVSALAEKLEIPAVSVVKFLMMDLGVMATQQQNVDAATAKAVADGLGYRILGEMAPSDFYDEDDEEEDDEEEEAKEDESEVLSKGAGYFDDDEADLVARPPVVTIMGHVDHGKTSLLDAIRGTRVVSGEAGGITQHVGAYQVGVQGGRQKITFLDTPGHAAFSEMRQRGADCTDVVVLVVAADDGVKEQTIQSLTAARQAGKPVIVAFNKVDKEGADVTRVATELASNDLLVESLGGDVLSAQVSAKTGKGLDDLLEQILLQSEVLNLKANSAASASGVVVEARVERGVGTVVTMLVQRGTLKLGDSFIAGEAFGKVRTLTNDQGEPIEFAPPGMPVQVSGLDGIPGAGDLVIVGDDKSLLRDVAAARTKIAREKASAAYAGDLASRIKTMMTEGETKELKEITVLVKADVQGSAEALASSLTALVKEDEIGLVKVKVLQAGVGDVTKTDVAIAAVSNAWVIGFNVAASFAAQEEARLRGIELGYYSVVYDALEEMEKRMEKILSPTPDGVLAGKAEVRQVFDIGKVGKVAGCVVDEGAMFKSGTVRVMRGPRAVHEGTLRTLKSFKENVASVDAGNECGINFYDWEDMEEGDVIECYMPE